MLNHLSQKLAEELERLIPDLESLSPRRELQSALQAALRSLDLVTREEFDAQAAVLQRTRERLEALEEVFAAQQASQAPSDQD